MKKLKKYPAYKDSGIEWIGEIPEHWEVRKLKYIASIYNGNSLNDKEKVKYESYNLDDVAYLSSKDISSETLYASYNNGLRIPVMELSNFKVAPKNTTLLCIEGGSAGKKITYLQDSVCFVNKLACFNSYDNTFPKYTYFSLQSSVFRCQFNSLMTGLIGGVSLSNLKNCNIPLPPLSEQKEIASFLDKKTAEIDKAIELKQKENELLKERRQVAINLAVTRGLDPNVRLKDSGIEWIGEIPEHWEVRKLKHLGEIKNGATPSSSTPSFWNGNIVWVTPADIDGKMYTSTARRN
ncbi:MAG: restriction endonuclease subunit S, partial [Bacteroides sp.]